MASTSIKIDDVIHRFTNHPPKDDLVGQKLDEITTRFIELASFIVSSCPDGRETSLVLTNLEQASMWSKASVARNQ